MRRVAGIRRWGALLPALALAGACGGEAGEEPPSQSSDAPEAATGEASAPDERDLTALWNEGVTAFGVYVPRDGYTEAGAAQLAANPLYDYLFLNLEGAYEPEAVRAVAAGLEGSGVDDPPALLVRIPPISEDGAEATGARVSEILDAGADGVVLPHIRTVEEARTAVSFFRGRDVWSPDNPEGEVVAMLMLEDPEAIAQLDEVVALGGYSVLACGIGSLTAALDGDREAAEAMNLQVLEAANEAGYADMITAGTENVAERVEQGYLALLMAGPEADEAIRMGREAAGR
jgi:2-keto-3-deoxy-L-rhamnonate aldolase RhmA